MSNRNPLTARSTEVAQRSYPFQNVSGEKIPPFAAMQVVGDPKNWKAFASDPNNDVVDISFKKIENIATTNQFDNGLQLWCDKPSAVSELFQDHSMIAFNGDSEVGVDSGGRCFFGEYPTRALIRFVPSLNSSYAPKSGSWYLHQILGRYGTYRAFCDTQQRVTVPVDGKDYETRVVNITTHHNLKLRPAVLGQFGLDANLPGTLNIESSAYQILTDDGEQFANDLAFGKLPSLTMRVNAKYTFSITAFFRVQNPPAEAVQIPIQWGITPYSRSDQDKFKSDFYEFDPDTGRHSYPIWYVQKFKKVDGVVSPINVGETLDPDAEVRWASMRIFYYDRLSVSKAPTTVNVQQFSSPYVQGNGSFQSMMEYDRIGSDIYEEIAGFNGYGYGAYSNGGYGYWGYNPYNPYNLQELPSGLFLPNRQHGFQYFDPQDPWMPV